MPPLIGDRLLKTRGEGVSLRPVENRGRRPNIYT
jgi:hypothetical protein